MIKEIEDQRGVETEAQQDNLKKSQVDLEQNKSVTKVKKDGS